MAALLWLAVPHLTHSTGTISLALGTAAAILLGATTYIGTVIGLWVLTGQPKGIEAIVVGRLRNLLA
jgi:hypothetical protein